MSPTSEKEAAGFENATLWKHANMSQNKIKVKDLNLHLTCVLCGGYYIDATTIIECLHSFCKTCIVQYLQTNKFCPICDVQVHKTRPLLHIRSDPTLQDIVYKLVPGLFKDEMKRRREFFKQHPEIVPSSIEESGLGGERLIFTPEDIVSISMEYCPKGVPFPQLQGNQSTQNHCRYLRCPGALTVAHLKKLLHAKYSLLPKQKVDIMYMHDYLIDEYTMVDLAYIYSWRRNGPIRLFYKIRDKPAKTVKRRQQAVNSVVKNSPETAEKDNNDGSIHSPTNNVKHPSDTAKHIKNPNYEDSNKVTNVVTWNCGELTAQTEHDLKCINQSYVNDNLRTNSNKLSSDLETCQLANKVC